MFSGDNQSLKQAGDAGGPESVSAGSGRGFEYKEKHEVTIVIKSIVFRSKAIRLSALMFTPE